LVGETLEHYGEAVGHEEGNKSSESNSTTNASSSVSMGTANSSTSEVANSNMSQVGGNASSSAVKIVNEAAYQTAQALSSSVVELYMDVKSKALNSTAAENAQTGLEMLKSDLDKKVPFDTIDKLIDSTITPALNSAYNLKLKMEEG